MNIIEIEACLGEIQNNFFTMLGVVSTHSNKPLIGTGSWWNREQQEKELTQGHIERLEVERPEDKCK